MTVRSLAATRSARRTAVRRIATLGAVGLPLALTGAGVALASPDHGSSECGGAVASQEGGLVGADAAVDPSLNIGGVLNDGPVQQRTTTIDESNSGIAQSGGCWGDELSAAQVDDLVGLGLDVSPSANVGGILNSGPVQQSTTDVDRSNTGVLQSGGWGADSSASQAGGLVGVDADVSPSINLGGILSSGAVSQSTTKVDSSNSGIVQG